MKRILKIAVFSAPLLMATSCTNDDAACVEDADEVSHALFRETVTVDVPRHAGVVNPELCAGLYFHSVESDSRCPKDKVCVWEGEATVCLQIKYANGTTDIFSLSTWANSPYATKIVEVAGNEFEVSLLNVIPYPDDPKTQDEAYATVKIVLLQTQED